MTDIDRLIRDLDWNLLRTFMVIAQENSITQAAHRLRLRQPSVSQALQRLEQRLETQLIDRGPSHFRITPAGQVLFQECQEIFSGLARTVQSAKGTDDVVTGRVKIAMLSGVESTFFDQTIGAFHKENPAVSYEFDVTTSKAAQQAVLDKTASVGVCLVSDRHPNLHYDVLYRANFGFFCGPDHPLFGRENLQLDDLRGHSSVTFRTDQLWDALRPVALLRAQHRLDDKVIGYTSNLREAQRMILAGLGFGPLPVHFADHLARAGLLWRLPPYGNTLPIDIHLVHHVSARLNRAEEALLDMFQTRMKAVPLEDRSRLTHLEEMEP